MQVPWPSADRAGLVVGDPSEDSSRDARWIVRSDATGVIAKGSVSFGTAILGAPTGPSRFIRFLSSR
ncbi:hypothetical protein [Streptomyces sp. NPDC056227]|uniref:hypothetical protein n=1 Tax=Streptomyces sp. NPDC056227 TaxID=3345753 RepID=UPI0035DD089A